jgi:hypothetical protein
VQDARQLAQQFHKHRHGQGAGQLTFSTVEDALLDLCDILLTEVRTLRQKLSEKEEG